MKFNDLYIGKSEYIEKIITNDDVINFSHISLDYNPLHLDKEFAKNTIFKDRIVHGMLVASLISAVLGTKLPGEGSIYLKQELKFVKPVFIGDKIRAICSVCELNEHRKNVVLNTLCIDTKSNETVIEGYATIKMME